MVLWPTDTYRQEVLRQLGDMRQYHKFPSDPTEVGFQTKAGKLLTAAKNYATISKPEYDFMSAQHPVAPTFYILAKIHKSLENPPGKPIVAGIGRIYKKVCVLIDFVLQPLVLNLPSYLRDSNSNVLKYGSARKQPPHHVRCRGTIFQHCPPLDCNFTLFDLYGLSSKLSHY